MVVRAFTFWLRSPKPRSGQGRLAARVRVSCVTLRVEPLEYRALPSLFGPPVDYPVGTSPFSVAVGDFYHDGHADLVTADGLGRTVSVLRGNGDGTFQSAVHYPAGSRPSTVTVADLRGNGDDDLILTDFTDGTVSVWLGNGDGTFQPHQDYRVGSGPVGVCVADFNGDGHLDLVVASQFSYDVTVLLGNGDGTFQPGVSYRAGVFAREVAAGDINGDGKLDLVVANQGDDTVSVLINNGDGTFRSAVNYPVGPAPTSITLGDFRGNGRLDVVTANFTYGGSTSTVSVLLGNGDGTFQPAQSYQVGANAHNVQAADLDGDGRLDLVVVDNGSNSVSVLLGNGDGTFQPRQDFAVGAGPDLAAFGDFNGTGTPSLAVANGDSNTVSVLLNQSAVAATTVEVSAPDSVTAGQPFDFTVTILDQFGRTDTGYTGTVHFTSSDDQAGLPADYTFTAADAGSHTFSAGATFFQQGSQTLTATDLADPTLTGSTTVVVNAQVEPVAYFDISYAGPVTAGQPFQLTVTARDANGQVVTGYRGQIGLFSLFGEDDLRQNYVFTADDAGSHTFTVTLNNPGMVGILVTDTDSLALGFTWVTVQ
jgi:hypothetical protein